MLTNCGNMVQRRAASSYKLQCIEISPYLVFTARLHVSISVHPSVCPSVRLFVESADFAKTKKKLVPTLLYYMKDRHLSFVARRMVGA